MHKQQKISERLERIGGHLLSIKSNIGNIGNSGMSTLNVKGITKNGNGLENSYDYIIVGAGSAGCVLASRLSEDPKVSVLLIEAGPTNQRFMVRTPLLFGALQNTELDWAFRTTPQPEMHGRVSHWPRGKMLGGSSSMNAMFVVRGDPRNYNKWAKNGCSGWSYDDLLPYFKKIENNSSTRSRENNDRGKNGPVHVTDMQDDEFPTKDMSERFVAGCASLGQKSLDDYNGPSLEGAGLMQVNIKNGIRQDAATCYLYNTGAVNRPNLTIATETHCVRVIFQGKKATGVTIVTGNNDIEKLKNKNTPGMIIDARKEVILSAGAVGTPWILMLSGVGPQEHLKEHGIPVVADLPVGQNLQDHLFAFQGFPARKGKNTGFTERSYVDVAKSIFDYFFRSKGLWMYSGGHAMSFYRTGIRPEEDGCDAQIHYIPMLSAGDPEKMQEMYGLTYEYAPQFKDENVPDYGVTFLPTLVLPKSVGEIKLKSKNPFEYPNIDPKYLSHEDDLKMFVKQWKFCRKIAQSDPMKEILEPMELIDKTIPYPPESDEYIIEVIRKIAVTVYHPVGTAKMGLINDKSSVVDPASLKIHGLKGIRIADASIMPEIVSVNTNVPSMMIGEKAADLILKQ